jgi:hypothetical protein
MEFLDFQDFNNIHIIFTEVRSIRSSRYALPQINTRLHPPRRNLSVPEQINTHSLSKYCNFYILKRSILKKKSYLCGHYGD